MEIEETVWSGTIGGGVIRSTETGCPLSRSPIRGNQSSLLEESTSPVTPALTQHSLAVRPQRSAVQDIGESLALL